MKFYESIVHKGRGVKEEARKKFNLVSLSTLNTILENKEETIRKLNFFRKAQFVHSEEGPQDDEPLEEEYEYDNIDND
jgi:hypothetical protein